MTSAPTSPEWIELAKADEPRDVVHRAVACLAQGGLVALPSETAYGVAASALSVKAVERLKALHSAVGFKQLTLYVRGPKELLDWVPDAPDLAKRIASRAWPGPTTLVLRGGVQRGLVSKLDPVVRSIVAPGDQITLRCSRHPFIREVQRLLPGPLLLDKMQRGAATTPKALGDLPDLDMTIDDGPTELGGASTVVDVSAKNWSILRPGVVSTRNITQMAGTIVLFVCTGNTCRSPMAEAICKAMLARRLNTKPERLEEQGYVVISAGVGAMHGMPAASHAVEVVKSRGGALHNHSSRPATPDLIRQADHIIAMANEHLDVLLDRVPEAADRSRLLDPEGGDLEDPIGTDRDNYQRTAMIIEKHVNHLLDDLGFNSA